MKGLRHRAALGFAVCLAFLTLVSAPASAQETRYVGVNAPPAGRVLATTGERATVVPPGAVQGQGLSLQVSGGGVAATQQARGGLAFTGADIVTMVLMGLSAMAVGVVLTRRARPRTTTSLD